MDRRGKLAMARQGRKPAKGVRQVARLEDISNVGPAVAGPIVDVHLDPETGKVPFLRHHAHQDAVKAVSTLPPAERPAYGKQANQVKVDLTREHEAAEARLREEALEGSLASERLDVTLPGVEDQIQAAQLVHAAHQVCPYSNATRGNIDVTLTVNGFFVGLNQTQIDSVRPGVKLTQGNHVAGSVLAGALVAGIGAPTALSAPADGATTDTEAPAAPEMTGDQALAIAEPGEQAIAHAVRLAVLLTSARSKRAARSECANARRSEPSATLAPLTAPFLSFFVVTAPFLILLVVTAFFFSGRRSLITRLASSSVTNSCPVMKPSLKQAAKGAAGDSSNHTLHHLHVVPNPPIVTQ